MVGRDGRTLEPSDDPSLQRIPLVVRVHWTDLPHWGGVRADGARDHVHCMRPLRYNSRVSWRFRRKAGSLRWARVAVIYDRRRPVSVTSKDLSPLPVQLTRLRMALVSRCPSPRWVKTGKAQCEHMFSALPSNSDIARCSRHVRKVPNPDFACRPLKLYKSDQ